MTNGEVDANTVITVVFKGPGDEDRLEIKVKGKTPFCKLANAVMKKRDVAPGTYRFADPDGKMLNAKSETSVMELEIGDMDVISIGIHQDGGAHVA
ncbi:hypothetical protein H9P43_008767 [Blastocladiella emersonii ATCC 22665]|nr:hypothetical protein H9P43_008767 [Blastocladiella emersonii ATCC 22665]